MSCHELNAIRDIQEYVLTLFLILRLISNSILFWRNRELAIVFNESLVVVFNSTFRYIDDVLSINNNQFHSYVDSIYPNELETKDTSAPHLLRI
jgi:hypothetical protein